MTATRALLLVLLLALTSVHLACAQRQFDQGPTSTSGGPLSPEQAAYNVSFYDLDLTIDPDAQTIDGALRLHANVVQPLGTLVLDLDTALTVTKVDLLEGEVALDLPFRHTDGQIRADLPLTHQPGEQVVARVRYGGTPREAPRPPWIGGFTWAETEDGQPWIATSNQGEGADLWWPVKDHPSDEPDSMALHITVPEPLVVATNGQLRSVKASDDGTRTYHWFVSTPINNYGVALNIAPYRTIEETYTSVTGETMPVIFWVLPERYEAAQQQFPQFVEHLNFYERTLGPYPFRADKYGIAHTPHLGMEHQTIIAYGDDFDDEPRGFDWLHHHELGHEWWGNLVTAPDWNDFWIHEGFCTYMQALYAEERFGREAYHDELNRIRNTIRNEKPLAPHESRTTKQMYFSKRQPTVSDNDIYYKGAWVLHTLRYLLGEDTFRQALRRMAYPTPEMEAVTDGRQTRFATTDDFHTLTEAIAETDLDWFFEVYVRQPKLPRLAVEEMESGLLLRWETADDQPFPMPVPVRIDGELQRVAMDGNEATVPLPDGADYEVDPDGWVLKAE
ncbi:MAG: M1 family peptidase [Bacteroidetes bacterium]|jgi:aminopeptidase N|nr:M1 family peptidase [Bacteroidota bacterium]